MFLHETNDERQLQRFGRSNCGGGERPFSRFSTPSFRSGAFRMPHNHQMKQLKRMQNGECKSHGGQMSPNSVGIVATTTQHSLDSQQFFSSSSDVSSATTLKEDTTTIQSTNEQSLVAHHHSLFCPPSADLRLTNSVSSPSVAEPPPFFNDVIFEKNPCEKLAIESLPPPPSTTDQICPSPSMHSKTLKVSALGSCQLSRSTSLMPSPSAITALRATADAMRRRSLSPLTLSLLVNYGGQQHSSLGTGSGCAVSSSAAGDAFSAIDPHFPGKLAHRRAQSVPRRSLTSNVSDGDDSHQNEGTDDNNTSTSGGGTFADAAAHSNRMPPFDGCRNSRPRSKPPSLLVYCADDGTLFDKIQTSLRQIVPPDTYTISALSTRALLCHPWMDSCACLIIADTSRLNNDDSWNRLQQYFANSGKLLFVCENSLLASLTRSTSQREQLALLKNALGNKAITATMGKEFGHFLKQSLKGLSRDGQINETFYARDAVGDTRFSVVLHKKKEQPLLLYMQNLGQRASALFSDATTEQLLNAGDGALICDALRRLGLKDIRRHKTVVPLDNQNDGVPSLSPGYLIAARDLAILDIPGMTYGKVLDGSKLSLIFSRSDRTPHQSIDQQQQQHDAAGDDGDDRLRLNDLPTSVSDQLLPVEVRRRRDGLPAGEGPCRRHPFDVEKYFQALATKRLGTVLLYVPVCRTTMEVASSLSRVFPLFDGILVVAGIQLAGRGRTGNDWISPAGCAMFTFNFNIPCDSHLGRSIGFLQHIVAVSMASAVSKLLKDEVPAFPIRLKWPNDLYYERAYKLGGLIVRVSHSGPMYCCAIGGGLNVANAKPTVCINDMLPLHSSRQLTVEEVLAETMNEFEHFVNVFENRGRAEFLKAYYKFWMHSHEEVNILHREGGDRREKVVIRGLDEHGYLEVRSKETGQTMSVMDDGNTFDLFCGLIVPK